MLLHPSLWLIPHMSRDYKLVCGSTRRWIHYSTPLAVLQWPVCKPYIHPCMAIEGRELMSYIWHNRRPAQHLCPAQPSSPHASVCSPSPRRIGKHRVLCEPIAKDCWLNPVHRTSPCARMTYVVHNSPQQLDYGKSVHCCTFSYYRHVFFS